jgi:putative phosphoesterase
MTANNILVGVISDTHGLLRAEALQALRGSDLILHAGDVGQPEIISKLREIAPVFPVRGNVDTGSWAAKIPLTETVAVGDVVFYLLHDRADLDLDPGAAGFSAVVYGHSHQPLIANRGDVLFLNPGSAGPRRFKLPVTVARVRVSGRELAPEIITLDV